MIHSPQKKFFFISTTGTAVFIGTLYFIENYCRNGNYRCSSVYEILWMFSMIFVPMFVCGVFVFFQKEEIFFSWRKFTFGYLLFYAFVLIVSPWQADAYIPISKETMSFLFTGIYAIASIIFVFTKACKLKGK
jgi:hypothetical protein